MQLTAPVSPTQRIRAMDMSKPLQDLGALDVNGDHKLNMADATAFERVAETTRGQARRIGDAASGAQLLEFASQLDYTAQQARYGAAMLGGAAVPSAPTTVHDIVPSAPLAQGSTPKDVIAAIGAVDTTALRAAGVKPVATFDVDGTSIRGDIYIPFAERMAREGRFASSANDVFKKVLATLDVDQTTVAANDANANGLLLVSKIDPALRADSRTAVGNTTGCFAVADALAGQKLDDLMGVAHRLLEQGVGTTPPYKDRVNDDSTAAGDSVPDVVAALEANHIEPHIVTWGFDFLARAAAPYLGIDPAHVIGTHIAVGADGVVTGNDARTVSSKDIMVRRETGTVPLFAFGDSGTDLKMLDLAAARGIVVNPSASMRAAIDERHGALGEVRYSATLGETAAASPKA